MIRINPENTNKLRTFLGIANDYNRVIPNVKNFHLECEASFIKVKNKIISDTILTHYDPDLTFILQLQMPDLLVWEFVLQS